MKCDEFGRRMHQRLDDRWSLERDDELCRHARDCESCRSQFQAWCQVASIMPANSRPAPIDTPRKAHVRSVAAVAGLAAAILCMVTMGPHSQDALPPRVGSASVEHDPAVLVQTGELDPALWWQSVQNRDWVGQTMPAVQSVRDGVAPIGRSLMRAVTILTTGGGEQTS
jgi:hypothetical protein